MTLEKLIQIVCEAVEKIMYLEKLEVRALVFDPAKADEIEKTAREISSRAQLHIFSDTDTQYPPCDILIMDQIPGSYLPKLALGIFDDPFTKFMSQMIIERKKILVLDRATGLPDQAPASCKALLETYQSLLEAHGIEFQEGKTPFKPASAGEKAVAAAGKTAASASSEGTVYTGNVLSRTELLEHAKNGVITVAGSVLITELAKDTAIEKKITIKKVGEC